MSLEDNKIMILIDYEYSGWNPMAFDLGNYLNECMLENAYPHKNGINWYIENVMLENELQHMVQKYMQIYFTKYMNDEYKSLKEGKYKNDSQLFIDLEYENFLK